MAAYKLFRLLALAVVAVVALSAAPAPANALVADREHVARHAHGAVARRKRSDPSAPSSSGLCQPRPTSVAPTSSPAPASAPPAPTSSTTPAPPPTTSAAPSPTSSAPAPAPTTGSQKRGLAWTNDPSLLSQWDYPSIGYLYTWSETIPSSLPSGWQGIPMCWGWQNAASFQSTVVQGYASIALGQNEPNEPSQSNMDPETGLQFWMTYLNPLKDQGYQLGSPACTDDDAGKQWYTTFFNGCWQTPGCKVDFAAFHAYNTNPDDVINYANWLYNLTGLPVWITEIADQDFSGANQQADSDQINAFVDAIKAFADSTSWMGPVFPFGAMPTQYLDGVNPLDDLMNSDGSPNALAARWFT